MQSRAARSTGTGAPTRATSERTYGGRSAAARVDERRGLLVDAALTSMSENHWRSATVATICSAAGLNKRYFYESFETLDALADAVVDQVAAEVERAAVTAQEAVPDASVEVQSRAAVDAVVDVLGSDRRRARVLLAGSAGAPSAHLRRTEAMRRLTATFVEHARLRHEARGHEPFPPTAVAFLVGGTAQAVLSWAEGDLEVDREQLVTDVTALWLSLVR